MRLICSMLDIVFDMLVGVGSGLVSTDAMRTFDAPMVAIPQSHYLVYDFQFSLIPAFLMAGTAAMLRTVEVITTVGESTTSIGNGPAGINSSRHLCVVSDVSLAAYWGHGHE
jgi:hypothetical protein